MTAFTRRTGVIRLAATAALGAGVAAALVAPPAQADAPLIIEDIRFDAVPEVDGGLSEYCGFPVTVATSGRFRGTVFFDADGNFRQYTGHPSMRETFASPYASFQTSDRGVDKISLDPEGNVLVFGTGIHLKVDGVVSAIGLWRLSFDPDTGQLVGQEYHGNFDVTQPEIGDTLCALLGPTDA